MKNHFQGHDDRWWQLKDFWNFHPDHWGNDPIWLIFFRWVGKNHQLDEDFLPGNNFLPCDLYFFTPVRHVISYRVGLLLYCLGLQVGWFWDVDERWRVENLSGWWRRFFLLQFSETDFLEAWIKSGKKRIWGYIEEDTPHPVTVTKEGW